MSMETHTIAEILRREIDRGTIPEGSEAHALAIQVAEKGRGSVAPHQQSTWDSLIQPLLDDIGERIRDIDEGFAKSAGNSERNRA